LFSGGISSFVATYWLITHVKISNLRVVFFNTKIEDEDSFRFIKDCEKFLNIDIQMVEEGRNPWEVFRDERFIGNSRITPCNRVLKRRMLEKMIKNRVFNDDEIILVFGISKNEINRKERIEKGWLRMGVKTAFPLINDKSLGGISCGDFVKNFGIEPPRLYKMGFKHNNCGGACVKAGISQWKNLLDLFPERYRWHENEELKTRKLLNKNVSILRDRRGGLTRPMTLKELRQRIETNG
jgi:3'-phosphoadenosine 5'-phosphosulfate sulfotransferase (PAPS reductase)/FAD synthetase